MGRCPEGHGGEGGAAIDCYLTVRDVSIVLAATRTRDSFNALLELIKQTRPKSKEHDE